VRQKEGFIKIGYVRVSKHEQNEALQIDTLRKAGCEKWFVDKSPGQKRNERDSALSHLKHEKEGHFFVNTQRGCSSFFCREVEVKEKRW